MRVKITKASEKYFSASALDSNGHDLYTTVGRTKLEAMKRLSDGLCRLSNQAQKASDKLEEKIERLELRAS